MIQYDFKFAMSFISESEYLKVKTIIHFINFHCHVIESYFC